MATDFFIRNGLTQPQMAEVARKYRNEFDMKHAEFVNIIEILEFKIPKIFPGFRLIIRDRKQFSDPAITEPKKNRIIVREDIYDNACEGDSFSRFILAHELGHFLLHKETGSQLHRSFDEYREQFKELNSIESSEDQADIFARHFLIHPYLAFKYRNNCEELSRITGTPRREAAAAVTISKRREMIKIRSFLD